jgi:hypothetical protein
MKIRFHYYTGIMIGFVKFQEFFIYLPFVAIEIIFQ